MDKISTNKKVITKKGPRTDQKTSPKIYVLTGGPCAGKSSVLSCLADMGYYTIKEAAAYVIEHNLKKGGPLPWTNRLEFQRQVLRLQIKWESSIPDDVDIVFVDRGRLDGIAFFILDNLTPPSDMINKALKAKYSKIFCLDLIPNYKHTVVRREDPDTAKRIHSIINDLYLKYGYEVIEVPVMKCSEERAKWIIKHL